MNVKLYQRTESLFVTRFCVSNAWLRKSTYHQGWARAPEHSWTINMIPSKQSQSQSQHQHCDSSALSRNDDWISMEVDEPQEQGIRIDK